MGFALSLLDSNWDFVKRLRAHPLAGGGEAGIYGEVDMPAYLQQGKAAIVEAAPLFAAITLHAPTTDVSKEAYLKFREFFSSVETFLAHWIEPARDEEGQETAVLPSTHAFGSYVGSLAPRSHYVGSAALAAIFQVLCGPEERRTSTAGMANLQADLVATTQGAAAKAVLDMTNAIVDLTPEDDRAEVAAIYNRSLRLLRAFWCECWEFIQPRN